MESKIKLLEIFFKSLTKGVFIMIIILNLAYIFNNGFSFVNYFSFFESQSISVITSISLFTFLFMITNMSELRNKYQFKSHIIIKYINYDFYYQYINIGRTIGFLLFGLYLLFVMINISMIEQNIIFIIILYISLFLIFAINIFVDSIDLSIVYFKNYLKYHKISDLRKGFDYLNNLHENEFNKELLNKIINIVNAPIYFEKTEYDKIIENLITTLGTKNLKVIRSSTLEYIKSIDPNIKPDEIIRVNITLIDKLDNFIRKNIMNLISLCISIISLLISTYIAFSRII